MHRNSAESGNNEHDLSSAVRYAEHPFYQYSTHLISSPSYMQASCARTTPGLLRNRQRLAKWTRPGIYQSSHLSSFLPAAGPEPLLFFIALVPMPEGLGFCPRPDVVFALASPAPANSSQKSCLSLLGPLGGAPKSSQKSFFAGSAPRRVLFEDSPSTNRLNAVPAFAAEDWMV